MVQAVENLTQFTGTIVGIKPHPELSDYDNLTVEIEHAQPVEGKANMIGAKSGERIEVTLRRELLAGEGVGRRIHFRASRTSGGVMSEPHPEPGDFRID